MKAKGATGFAKLTLVVSMPGRGTESWRARRELGSRKLPAKLPPRRESGLPDLDYVRVRLVQKVLPTSRTLHSKRD